MFYLFQGGDFSTVDQLSDGFVMHHGVHLGFIRVWVTDLAGAGSAAAGAAGAAGAAAGAGWASAFLVGSFGSGGAGCLRPSPARLCTRGQSPGSCGSDAPPAAVAATEAEAEAAAGGDAAVPPAASGSTAGGPGFSFSMAFLASS
mmetsp:Transcript_41218/g.106733  ORF Transcript_41218/g.106733 Transcript_41218/m.106733 type:complete len:145 (+) Transcript_41218:1031-1465(+)